MSELSESVQLEGRAGGEGEDEEAAAAEEYHREREKFLNGEDLLDLDLTTNDGMGGESSKLGLSASDRDGPWTDFVNEISDVRGTSTSKNNNSTTVDNTFSHGRRVLGSGLTKVTVKRKVEVEAPKPAANVSILAGYSSGDSD